MALPGRLESRITPRALAALLSAALHFGLLLIIALSGGRHDGVESGDTPITQLVLLEAATADHREGLDLTPLQPAVPTAQLAQQLQAEIEPPAPLQTDARPAELVDTPIAPADELPTATDVVATNAIQAVPAFAMPPAERSALAQHLARLAEEFVEESPTQVAWEQDGKQYSARLTLQRANDGTALDRVVAEVSAADRGKQLSTRVILKRLAFSQFAQMVDHWDPTMQLHDDVIVGRFHSNSRFNALYDSRTGPKLLGKVTTAARSFNVRAMGRGRESDIFRAGVETRTSRINLPEALWPFEWAPQDGNARVHELARDTRIRFFADGSYTWRTDGAPAPQYLNAPSEHPVYFIAANGATLRVQGVVAGKILVYSPHRIVVEGNLRYAHDPREVPDSRDYLGLVCDRYIEVASAGVTGPGDLDIHAAIFAGRRFVVRDIEHPRPATLRIFGSVAAGSLSASEPRYATKVEYDERFEQRRPPGFPSTNRYELEDWDGQWTEAAERTANDAL